MPKLVPQFGWQFIVLLVFGAAMAQEQSPAPGQAEAAKPPAVQAETPTPSKRDIKRSEKLFNRALRLQTDENKLPEALEALDESTALNPAEPTYATTREYVRQELVSKHLERGNSLLDQNHRLEAVAEFREALALDPSNAFAEQRLRDAWAFAPERAAATLSYSYASEPQMNPRAGTQNFSFRGDSRQLLQTLGRAFGIEVTFDDSFPSRPVRLDVQDVDFFTAMEIVRKLTRSFYLPVSETQVLFAADTQDVRRRLERMSLRTFYVPTAGSPQEFQEVVNVLRSMLDIRFVTANPAAATITVRAPTEILDAAAQIIDNLSEGRPQVLFEIRALQVNESSSRQLGITLPLQFTIFNVTTEARKLAPNSQDLINRFLNGTATPADIIAAQALLAAGSGQNSPLLKGFATFGGGIFQGGVVIPPASVTAQFSKTLFTSLQHMTLRAEQGHAATFRVGDRFPVLTGSYSPVLNLPVTGAARQITQPLVPSFNYEDLGITLKATPEINANSEVTTQIELQIKALGGISFNQIPTISNREYKGTITVRDGETSVLAGSIDSSEQKSLSGIPWVSSIPGLGRAVSSSSKQTATNEILLLVTPHVLRAKRDKNAKTESYLDGN